MFKKYSASLTRPNNADAYTARDTFGTAATNLFTLCSSSNGGLVKKVRAVGIMPTATDTFEVWLFGVAPTAQADNAAFSITDAEAANLLGIVPLTVSYTTALNRVLETALTTVVDVVYYGPLYAVLVVVGATTPVAVDKITLVVDVLEAE